MNKFDENIITADLLKKNEELMKNYLNQLHQGLSTQTLTIDKIETIMLNTMFKVKENILEACSKTLSDESKKKLLLEFAKSVEEMKLSHPSTAGQK